MGPVLALWVFETPPFEDLHVTAYFVIGAPLSAGAANATFSAPPALVARTAVGVAGAPTVIVFVKTEGGLVPYRFSATTLNR